MPVSRDRTDIQENRRSFRRKVRRLAPKRLVFMDETGITTTMTSADAWASRGKCVLVSSVPTSWATFTVIAALELDGCDPPGVPGGHRDRGISV